MTTALQEEKQPKILVVDDKRENLIAMQKLLRKVPAEVRLAQGGKEALSQIVHHSFAVVLLDVQMPDMDGYEVGELLRGHRETKNIPIIFLTANHKGHEFVTRGYEVGAIDYLCKPIDSDILLYKINFFLSLYNEQRQKQELIEMLKKARQRLETSNAELNQYAYLVSHDLQEPLRHINNTIEILLDEHRQAIDSHTEEQLQLVTQLCEKMSDLIQATLSFARVDHLKLDVVETDMHSLVKTVIAFVADHNSRSETVEIEGSLPTLRCNAHRMQEVFLNLINNGLKYNTSEEKKVVIRWNPDTREFCVEDNGVGIPEEFQEEVFNMCRRLEFSETVATGTGIGLALVKKIVEQHEGRIRVESRVNQGTRIYFTLETDS